MTDNIPNHASNKPEAEKPKRKWVILPILWSGLKRVAMGIGFMFLISLIISLYMVNSFLQTPPPELPEEMILFYRLEGNISEGVPVPTFQNPFGSDEATMAQVIETLDKAAEDDRVKALVFSLRPNAMTITQAQELRSAILEFKSVSGKPTYVFSTSFGEAGLGLANYLLASVFDEIWMQPLGIVMINGLKLEQPYLRAALNFIGVNPEFYQREEYKGIFEFMTETEMTEASRESLKALLENMIRSMSDEILESRPELGNEANFRALIDQGLFLDYEALRRGLVDRIDYADILADEIRDDVGAADEDGPLVVTLERYRIMSAEQPDFTEQLLPEEEEVVVARDAVAVIYIQGPIMLTTPEEGPLSGSTQKGAVDLASLITTAGDDDRIDAIILRIDSPGGSPTASELLHRAVRRVKMETDKPIIVSMGNAAASGGYWVAAPADYIFALPATLTGSIGVAGGKVDISGVWQNILINWDGVAVGDSAGFWSFNEPFSPSEEERVNALMNRTYNAFLARVAAGRNMSRAQAREVAQGRIWSGSQAATQGLVDELGGLADALDYTAVWLGHESRRDIDVITLPEAKTPLQQFLELFGQATSLPALQQSALKTEMNRLLLGDATAKRLQVLESGGPVWLYEPLAD